SMRNVLLVLREVSASGSTPTGLTPTASLLTGPTLSAPEGTEDTAIAGRSSSMMPSPVIETPKTYEQSTPDEHPSPLPPSPNYSGFIYGSIALVIVGALFSYVLLRDVRPPPTVAALAPTTPSTALEVPPPKTTPRPSPLPRQPPETPSDAVPSDPPPEQQKRGSVASAPKEPPKKSESQRPPPAKKSAAKTRKPSPPPPSASSDRRAKKTPALVKPTDLSEAPSANSPAASPTANVEAPTIGDSEEALDDPLPSPAPSEADSGRDRPQESVDDPAEPTPPPRLSAQFVLDISVDDVEVAGGLSQRKVRSALLRRLSNAKACLRDELAGGVTTQKRVQVMATIGFAGKLERVKPTGDRDDILNCLKESFQRARMPKPDTGQATVRFFIAYRASG
ncbi:MAG: hypothetical protein AAF449_07875, partial [Myxococcota bacterium]